MASTLARIKKVGKHFEIIVDMDKAIAYKKGQGTIGGFLESEYIFSDTKKGFKASDEDMEAAFGTTDLETIAGKIVKDGEVQVSVEHRNEEKEQKIKQVVDFLSKNASDPRSGKPYTPDKIKTAMHEAHVSIKNVPVEQQIQEIVDALSVIIPIKLETKRFKITIPAIHTGKVYGVIGHYKENEDWKDNGDLQMVVKVPAGLVMDFFDKLNSVTHGSALTEEIKEKL
ncbi:ribosome assembly factor SBDS [Candidatus Pacearchaeota archaeon CG10_big_fil_rev_8_21_14_0_10_32_14]|nr:MAG: ribosome assembly factor SBDS [Candidatus Pacearchaeota archaeon CG10_big_fil_rev_8_21_14_0_10_32_14]